MGLIDRIYAQVSTPRNIPSSAAIAVVSTDRGRVGKTNTKRLRAWSEHSEWIRAAINIRKTQVAGAEWDIVAEDPDQKIDEGLKREIKDRLEFANPKAESFRSFIEPIVEDILVLDAGSVEIEPNLRGEPLYLHGVDGGEVRVSKLWDGTDPNEPRYFWYPDNFERGRWRNDQFIYIMETPRTNSVVGLSKLETLAASIDAELEGHSYNARQVRNAAPDGLLHLGEGAKQTNIDGFKAMWQAEQGRGAMAITGGTKVPTFLKFHDSNADMQFLEWQIFLVRKIAAVMGMDPGDLGLGMDVNRSTAEVRDDQTEDRGIRPLLSLLSRHITREYVWSLGFGGQANNLAFRWTKLNLRESMAKAQIFRIALAGMPYMSPNEARKDTGRDPWGPEFDQPMMVTPQGAFALTDIPTVREFLDSKEKRPASDPTSTAPIKDYDAQFMELRTMFGRPERPVELHIDKGAVDVDVHPPVFAEGSIKVQVDAPTTVAEGAISINQPTFEAGANQQTFATGAVSVEHPVPEITVRAPDVTVEPTPVVVYQSDDLAEAAETLRGLYEVLRNAPPPVTIVRTEVIRDEFNRIVRKGDHMSDGAVLWSVVERDAEGRIVEIRRADAGD